MDETESIGVSREDEDSEDEETELDEDFQLTNKKYEDVKATMKKRMLALSQLDTFDNQVRSCSCSKYTRHLAISVLLRLTKANVKLLSIQLDTGKFRNNLGGN